MNSFLQIIVAAGDDYGENTFWVQILVFLLVAVSLGLYSLVKKKPEQLKRHKQRLAEQVRIYHTKSHRQLKLGGKYITRLKSAAQKYVVKARDTRLHIPHFAKKPMLDFDSPAMVGRGKYEPAAERNADLNSGMELLELYFLLSIVQDTDGDNKNDVTMRKLNFNELLRRAKLDQVSSSVLKVYAINQDNLYGKAIQCEATRELARRTSCKSKHKQLLEV